MLLIEEESYMKYCKKCILPDSMPLIRFDQHGICNYCNNYQKTTHKPLEELEKLVAPYRSQNGEPDCIIAFSGGRDSAYGLHYLKKELGMNPIAFTYDWGVVTDLARRNQARMVGKLGVEHIIVAADIDKKRRNIRKNIQAWLKRPRLGMVTLFMAGDKQCEYYITDIAKKNNIKLVFFCRGNSFENEEFKWGYCGIKNGSPNGVLHNLSLAGKIKILSFFAKEYLLNPAYINVSFWDTLFAYWVTYLMKLDFIYLWHYVKWDEKKIVSTLRNEYGWETEPDTLQTWRTDDGTSPFYNYIYHVMGGFTENDTFRSNQIREGILTREEAFALVKEENKPREKALKWYFDAVGLDQKSVLATIDAVPKRYDQSIPLYTDRS